MYITDFPLQDKFFKDIEAKARLNYSLANSAGYVDDGSTITILKKPTYYLIEGYNKSFSKSIVFRNSIIIAVGENELKVYDLKGKNYIYNRF
jgi:hypothetical protein